MAVTQVTHQPVRHFVRHDLGEKGMTILAIKQWIEAQPATPVVRLACTLATQVTPDLGAWQRRMIITAKLPGSLHAVEQGSMKCCVVEARKPLTARIG